VLDAVFYFTASIMEKPDPQLLLAVHRSERTRGHCHELRQGQLGLHMGQILHHGRCPVLEQPPVRVGKCGELSWVQTPATCSYCRVSPGLRKRPDEVTSRSPFQA